MKYMMREASGQDADLLIRSENTIFPIFLLIRSHTCGKAIGSNLEFMQLELSMN